MLILISHLINKKTHIYFPKDGAEKNNETREDLTTTSLVNWFKSLETRRMLKDADLHLFKAKLKSCLFRTPFFFLGFLVCLFLISNFYFLFVLNPMCCINEYGLIDCFIIVH